MHRPRALIPVLLSLVFSLGLSCGSSDPDPEAAQPPGGGPTSSSRPRHVLLIVIDTLRADHLSCYGYWRKTSPNIDGLVRRAVKFERAIAQSSWTSPSMISLMTGQRVSRKRFSLPDEKPTLAELFKDAGFKTGAWVSNPLLNHKNGFYRGFDRWTSSPLSDVGAVVAWLRNSAEEDTFTWVHFTDPHDPYLPQKSFRSQTPGRISEHQEALLSAASLEAEDQTDIARQRKYIVDEIGLYDDEIVAVDRKVRKLLMALEETGNLENAVVMLTADHGECLWERRESDVLIAHQRKTRDTPTRLRHILKQTHGEFLYQELVRVPLIIMAPGLGTNEIDERVVDAVNLAPTLLALAGVEVEGMQEMCGVDLFGSDVPPGAYTMTNQGEAFVSEDGWKLILPTEEGLKPYAQVVQLYDLKQDPGEHRNLAPEHPERVSELTLQIQERRARALPLLKPGDWESQTRANAQALRDLGYAGGVLADFEELEHDKDE